MKKAILAALLSLVAAAFLSGCSTTTEVVYKNKYVPIPTALLVKCDVTAPPDQDKYVLATHEQREDMLGSTTIGLYGDLATCNKRTDRLIQWNEQQKAIYGAPASAVSAGG